MKVRLFGDPDAPWIDDDELCTTALGRIDLPHEVQIAAGGVIAPNDDELCLTHLLQRRAGGGPEGAGVRGAADAATERIAAQ